MADAAPTLTLSDLPNDVVATLILDKLPLNDVGRFSCVCRWARSVADETWWACRARALTGGVDVDLADWGPGTTHKSLVTSLLAVAGPLLSRSAWYASNAGGVDARLGSLFEFVPSPPDGVTCVAVTPASLGGWHRVPAFGIVRGEGGAAPSTRCLRRGRPPRGRGAEPESHPAAIGVSVTRLGDQTVLSARLECGGGCRVDVVAAQARVAAAVAPPPDPVADGAPGGPARLGLPDISPDDRLPRALRSLGALNLAAPDDAQPQPLTLAPVPWPRPARPLARRQSNAPGACLRGIWKGTYGAHGVEVVGIDFDAGAACGPDPPLVATKLTGDFNVPACHTSFTIYPGAHGDVGVEASIAAGGVRVLPRGGGRLQLPPGAACDVDLAAADPPIVIDSVLPATGMIADTDYVNPRSVPCVVATLEGADRAANAFLLGWGGGMGQVSLFIRMEEGEMKGQDLLWS